MPARHPSAGRRNEMCRRPAHNGGRRRGCAENGGPGPGSSCAARGWKSSLAMVGNRVPDRFEIVGRVELGTVAAPSGLLDDAVGLAQLIDRDAQYYDLADPHHHIPTPRYRPPP